MRGQTFSPSLLPAEKLHRGQPSLYVFSLRELPQSVDDRLPGSQRRRLFSLRLEEAEREERSDGGRRADVIAEALDQRFEGGGGWRGGEVEDEAAESEVGDEREVEEGRAGDRARPVAGGEPGLDAGAVVGLTRRDDDRISHEVERDGAPEMEGNLRRHALRSLLLPSRVGS